MKRIEVNVETNEVVVIAYTPEEEAAVLASAANVQEAAPPKPTLEELQAQLAAISAQMQSLASGSYTA